MKKIGDLMADLGFREDAPDSLKRAFIEGLMKSLPTPPEVVSVQAAVPTPKKKPTVRGKTHGKNKGKVADPNQLSLFEGETPEPSDDDKAVG